MRSPLRVALLVAVFAAPGLAQQPLPRSGAEILWDTFGVPHIFAADDRSLFRAFGWAQARNHADLLLLRVGMARGRAAEYWRDTSYVRQDRYTRNMRIDDVVAAVIAANDPGFLAYIDAFAAGVNAYARAHPEAITDSMKVVLPLTRADVIATGARVDMDFSTADMQAVGFERGSNGWAIGPAKSATGKSILLANPHLPWSGGMTWFEAQLESPTLHAYGASLVGMPVLNIAFNDRLGWTHTVNTARSEDFFDITLDGTGYRWQGAVKPFEVDTQRMRIKQADGSLRDTTIVRRRSVHGPIIAQRGNHVLAVHRPTVTRSLLQWWEMAHAHDLASFRRAIDRSQILGQNIVYADADGNIMYHYGAAVPKREGGTYAFWNRRLPGDTAASVLWRELQPARALPTVINPPSGFVQNANDPPWFSTYPRMLEPDSFPAYFAPVGLALRPQRSIELLLNAEKLTFDDVVKLKHSTHIELADRVLPDLTAAARASGVPARVAAAAVLDKWDRTADAESRGGTLFEVWTALWTQRRGARAYAKVWSIGDPLRTPLGLADTAVALAALDAAITAMNFRGVKLDVAWGDMHRFMRDSVNLPANGAPGGLGTFRNIAYAASRSGPSRAVSGDSYVAVVEFAQPLRAAALIAYGNASQPGSPHRTDQLQFAARKEMRPVWRKRADIEKHATLRERVP